MRQSIRLGRPHGIPVGLHWSVLVIMLLLTQGLAVSLLPAMTGGYAPAGYWLASAGFAALLLVALLLHEYAHARAAQHYGLRVRSITLWMFGGVAELDGEPPHPRAELLIALAGPAASLATAGVLLLAVGPADSLRAGLLEAGLGWLAVMNIVLAVFNMLPGAPLDGGRALGAVIWWARGDRAAARRAAAVAGVVLGLVMALGGLFLSVATRSIAGLWLILLGWFLAAVAHDEEARLDRARRGEDVRAGADRGRRP
ncbi:hypothetical protein Ade02nite_70830 [Paractinoplanes deccanensis]|uniref:Peptidase M50 domain-containing protein n=1 Tax=Paractinoplanes deccanensis TaxID=113561 RepID=A0ABQ3YEL1_9ACTN|nr:site-2 protease family protein [Actinoplanes deccanensis]GID78442.1 hypothetical protein Ade02nite_70830 [Actinoplanes deccanensis]